MNSLLFFNKNISRFENNSDDLKPRVKAKELPGLRLILFSLYLNMLTYCLPILYHQGFHIPIRYIKLGVLIVVFPIFLTGSVIYYRRQRVGRLLKRTHAVKILIFIFLIFTFTGFGLVYNPLDDVVNEFFGFTYMAIVLLIGVDDRFWTVTMRHLTIIFFIGAVLILLYYKVPAVYMDSEQMFVSKFEIDYRSYNSIGYGLRPLIDQGLILGIWGLIQKKYSLLRLCQIGSLVLFFIINVVIFKFRSSGAFCMISILSFCFYRPILEKRIRIVTLIIILSVLAFGFNFYVSSESWSQMKNNRLYNKGYEELTNSRNAELNLFLSDLEYEVLFGRGLGGSFSAVELYGIPKGLKRYTTHYGIIGFLLKGGVFLLISFVSFLIPAFTIYPKRWYSNRINLCAAILSPIYILTGILNPQPFTSDNLFSFIATMAIFSRFGTRTENHLKSLKGVPVASKKHVRM